MQTIQTMRAGQSDASAMTQSVPAPAPPGSSPCVVCGTPVPAGAPPVVLAGADGAPQRLAVCGRAACRGRVSTLPALVRCDDCGQLLQGIAERAAGRCGTVTCRTLRVRRQRDRELDAQIAAEDRQLRSAAQALRDTGPRGAAGDGDDAPVVLLPSTDPRRFPMLGVVGSPLPTRLPRRRARALRAHVRRMATEAHAQQAALAQSASEPAVPDGASPATPDATTATLLGAACATCGGRCCRSGGERAYLDVESLRRWLAAHPGDGPRAAVAAYASYLPATSLSGSCVYHTTAGCALPRAMRSDTCNRYECAGLAELGRALRDRMADGRPLRRAFLAVVEDQALARTSWIGAH